MESVYILTANDDGLDIARAIKDDIPITGIIRTAGQLEDVKADMIFVLGWSRLLTQSRIDRCQACVGMHGSAHGITGGRGRSPQNWAIMLGHEWFSISIYALDAGADSGPVYDTRLVPIAPTDDIRTLHYRVSMATAEMLIEGWHSGRFHYGHSIPQEGEPRYLPQRRPEDGAIDWSLSTEQIHNFVRALTRPYPGAFSGGVRIWRGRPFDGSGVPGEVLDRLKSGELLVATGDGAYLVDDWEGEAPDVLESVDSFEQMRRIIDRHLSKYPNRPLADEIYDYIRPARIR